MFRFTKNFRVAGNIFWSDFDEFRLKFLLRHPSNRETTGIQDGYRLEIHKET